MNLASNEQSATVKKARAKKRKTETNDEAGPTKKPRRIRGMLKDLVEMPLDILYEIFGKLDPLDLVHVSRTTKALRLVLMSRSSKSVWHSARQNFKELPDCPNDLGEAQYAVLIFTKYCSFCLRNVATYTSWSARVRTCKKCLDQNFSYIDRQHSYTRHRFCYYPVLLASWLPLLKMSPTVRKRGDVWYYFDKLDRQWKEEYKAIVSPKSKIEWVNERLTERYAIEQHARKCELWYMKYHASPDYSIQAEVVAAEKKLKVAEFIDELGFGNVLAKVSPSVHAHPLDEPYVEQACVNGFGEAGRAAIKDRLIFNFKKLQRNQEVTETTHIFDTRKPLLSDIRKKAVQDYPVDAIIPSIRDIHELAEQHGFMDYSKTATDALSVPFSEIIALWKVPIESTLINLMGDASSQDHVFDRNKALHLATTFFECSEKSCPKSMRHDCAMVHGCVTRPALWYDSDDLDVPSREVALQNAFSSIEWNSSSRQAIQFGKEEWKTMVKVVQMAGLDPKTATAKEMDELNVVFECTSCNDIDLGRATMTWAAVRNHMLSAHIGSDQPPMDLVIITGRDAENALKRIQEEQMRKAHGSHCQFICTHCRTLLSGIKAYRIHLETEHKITSPPEDSELVLAPDQDRIPPLFRLWPPRYDSPYGQPISPDVTNSDTSSSQS